MNLYISIFIQSIKVGLFAFLHLLNCTQTTDIQTMPFNAFFSAYKILKDCMCLWFCCVIAQLVSIGRFDAFGHNKQFSDQSFLPQINDIEGQSRTERDAWKICCNAVSSELSTVQSLKHPKKAHVNLLLYSLLHHNKLIN